MSRELDAVRSVIQCYFDGLYDGDVQKLAQAFHVRARLYSQSDGVLVERTREEWLELVKARVAPRTAGSIRADRIVAIDLTDDAASAKVECAVAPRFFVDYLTLLKTSDQGWMIMSKTFQAVVR